MIDDVVGMLMAPARGQTQQHVVEGYGNLPWAFEINQGQAAQQVRFLSRGKGYTLFLTNSEAVMVLRDGSGSVPGAWPATWSGRLVQPTSPRLRMPFRATVHRMPTPCAHRTHS
jgi:hypothetical protein